MNIALFTDTYLPDINGVATSTNILRNELVEHGHNVLIVTTDLPTGSDYKDEGNVLRLPGLDIKKLYGYRVSSIFSYNGMKEIKEFAPEVIHIQTEFGIGIFGKIAGEILNIPVCYTYHTMWVDYSHYLNPANFKTVELGTKKIIEKISKIYGDTCSQLIVPSSKTAEVLKEYGISNSINVIPTGLKLNRFSKEHMNSELVESIKNEYNLHDKFVISFVGRIAQEKSIDFIIDAMRDIVKINSNICLVVTGGGPQLPALKEMVNEYGLNDNIYFTGAQDSSIIANYYHICDIFASASISETQGLTYIEAMACGKPVLARYDKNLEGVINDDYNGYFFNTKEEFVERVLELSNRDLTQLQENAYKDANNYSSEIFYQRIMTTYNKALLKYHYKYRVVSIVEDKNNSYFVGFQYDNHQVILRLSMQVIERYGISIGEIISREELDALKDHEQVAKAYNKALRYLSYKDYTYAKMHKKLIDKGEYDEIQVDMTMEILVQKGLIDDVEYTKNYFNRSKRLGIGVNKIVYNLKNEGISPFIIDEYLAQYSQDLEYEKAMELIEKLFKQNTNKPQYAIMQNIKNKLFMKGFSQSVVDKAIDTFDFTIPQEHTKMLITKEYHRVYNRYKNRYDERTLKSKIITFLVQKGYEYDDVITIMQELWEERND